MQLLLSHAIASWKPEVMCPVPHAAVIDSQEQDVQKTCMLGNRTVGKYYTMITMSLGVQSG